MEQTKSNWKKSIRQEITQRKRLLSIETQKKASSAIKTTIESLPLFSSSDTILLYHSLPDEVCTHQWIASWASSKQILLPIVCGEQLELAQYHADKLLQQGEFNIWEPTGERFTDYAKIDMAIIPGVAFDRKGNRLGRGKGYYDRLLPLLSCTKIAVCYHLQLYMASLPQNIWDIPMDMIISDREVIIPTSD